MRGRCRITHPTIVPFPSHKPMALDNARPYVAESGSATTRAVVPRKVLALENGTQRANYGGNGGTLVISVAACQRSH